MGPKLEAAVKSPPAGVQIWAACSAKQRSYETDDAPMGVFLKALLEASRKGVPNKIQKPDDPLPLEYFRDRVNELMAAELRPRKLEQTSLLGGQEADGGAPYDKNEPVPPEPTLASAPTNKGNEALVKAVLGQVSTPAVKPSQQDVDVKYDALPPFNPEVLKKYEDDGADKDSPLRKAVRSARAVLWAVTNSGEPKEIAAEVRDVRLKLKVNLSVLQDGFRAPAAAGEKQLKDRVEANERDVARIIGRLREALEEMQNAAEGRAAEPKRWQANYDFLLARLQEQIAFLFEYQSMLGQMRKEFPPRDPALHGGWKLAATTNLQGDAYGKKLAKESRKVLEKIVKEHAGTPWEVLAKREKLTALGLEWQATR
jgi:hypothetical protein